MKIQYLFLLIITLFCPFTAFSQNTDELVLNDVKIVLENETSDSLNIQIIFGAKSYPIKSEIVENPTRLVFDIEGLILGRGRIEQLKSPLIKQARIGVHHDKTRIVFDSKSKDLNNITESKSVSGSTFTISSSKTNIKNDLSSSSTDSKKAEQSPTTSQPPTITQTPSATPKATTTPTATATTTVTPTTTPSPLPTKSAEIVESLNPIVSPSVTPSEIKKVEKSLKTLSDVIDSSLKKDTIPEINTLPETTAKNLELLIPTLTPTPVEEITPVENESIKDVANKLKSQIGGDLETKTEKTKSSHKDDDKIIVKSIVFQTTTEKMQSSMVISTTAPISYSINQLSKNNYEVVIPTTKLKGEYLTLPQFPPDSFKGFVYFIANDDETGTRIKIETDDNVKLTPYIAMGKLWIQAE